MVELAEACRCSPSMFFQPQEQDSTPPKVSQPRVEPRTLRGFRSLSNHILALCLAWGGDPCAEALVVGFLATAATAVSYYSGLWHPSACYAPIYSGVPRT